jgi:hypothetical protein
MARMLLLVAAALVATSSAGRLRSTGSLELKAAKALRTQKAQVVSLVNALAEKYDCNDQRRNLGETVDHVMNKNKNALARLNSRCQAQRDDATSEAKAATDKAQGLYDAATKRQSGTFEKLTRGANADADGAIKAVGAAFAAANRATEAASSAYNLKFTEFQAKTATFKAFEATTTASLKLLEKTHTETTRAAQQALADANKEALDAFNGATSVAAQVKGSADKVCGRQANSSLAVMAGMNDNIGKIKALYGRFVQCKKVDTQADIPKADQDGAKQAFLELEAAEPCKVRRGGTSCRGVPTFSPRTRAPHTCRRTHAAVHMPSPPFPPRISDCCRGRRKSRPSEPESPHTRTRAQNL